MRIFVTGATGFIGSAIARDLMASGHQVVGLARSAEAVTRLTTAGLETHRGELADPATLVAAAHDADGVVHMAFGHDFSKYAEAIETDRRAVAAMADALEGSGKPLVIASGTLMVAHASPSTEDDVPAGPDVPRARSEAIMRAAADRGIRSTIVRLPPSVHDTTRAGFVTAMIAFARQAGFSAYVEDGSNRWPAVHRLDAARLFVLAVERGVAGTAAHAVAEDGIQMRTIAEAIGEELEMPVRSISTDDAATHFGWLARFITLDNLTSSTLTRERLGWRPDNSTLLADLHESRCYEPSAI